MQHLVPKCRVCGEPLTSLGTEEEPRWYCYKDDEIWLGEERGWHEPKPPATEQKQTMKFCKRCGNKLELEDEFCDKCGSGQKKIVAVSTGGQHEIALEKSQKPTGLWYLAPFFFGIIGGLVGYVAVKYDDKGMADNLLVFGIGWSILLFIVTLVFWRI